jgi:hypothetical protein
MRQIQHESGARIFFPTTRNTPPWAEPSGPDCITIVGALITHLTSHVERTLTLLVYTPHEHLTSHVVRTLTLLV